MAVKKRNCAAYHRSYYAKNHERRRVYMADWIRRKRRGCDRITYRLALSLRQIPAPAPLELYR